MSNTTPKKPSANLSKSRYTLSCQCLKALWLRVYKPEVEVTLYIVMSVPEGLVAESL